MAKRKLISSEEQLNKIIKSFERNRVKLINLSVQNDFFYKFDIIDTELSYAINELKKLRI